jgi:hypothetical protein
MDGCARDDSLDTVHERRVAVTAWWISFGFWVASGLVGLVWMPSVHPSWSRTERIVLLVLFIIMVATLGPIGLWQQFRWRQSRR